LFNGTWFWEYLYERKRKKNFENIISRFDSYFVFKEEKDCCYFRDNNRNGNGEIVGIEIEEIDGIFESDMQIMDRIENHYTMNKINSLINNYWEKKYSNEPIIEIFFKGKFKIVEA
jgi:hypothetical protein